VEVLPCRYSFSASEVNWHGIGAVETHGPA
jgi:hypothetical protein